jgi:catechol 2,3-dioxygenase-like lactoylglutathione lyase family enzyme
METMEIYRGRLLDHVQLVVADIGASRRFYRAVFEVLGIPIGGEGDDHIWADELFISTAESPAAAGQRTGRAHLAFQAESREKVEAFYRAGLASGGKDNGAPGERPYHPGYYAAFLLDPDGNNIEAVYHGPATRSAPAVKFTF